MARHSYYAEIQWERQGDFANNTYSRGHRWRFDGGIDVPASASPTVVPLPHSVEAAVDPEEAFVAALSSCHMLWFLDLARQAGLTVEAYEDKAEAKMGWVSRGKMAITKVTLAPTVKLSGSMPEEGVLDRLHHEAHEKCFIANSVTCDVLCEPEPVVTLDV